MRVGSAYNQANIFFYNYSDGTALGIKGPNGDNYLYSHVQVDAQGSFRLAKGFPTVVYGLNLTNEVFGFYQGSPIYPVQREYYNRTIGAGLRWNSTVEHVEQPDRLILDLDPGARVTWKQVIAAARLI